MFVDWQTLVLRVVFPEDTSLAAMDRLSILNALLIFGVDCGEFFYVEHLIRRIC